MDTTVNIAAAGIFSENVVEWMKHRGLVQKRFTVLLASYLVNFLTLLAMSIFEDVKNGTPITVSGIKALTGTIVSVLFHELTTPQSSN